VTNDVPSLDKVAIKMDGDNENQDKTSPCDAVLFGPKLQQGATHSARVNHALDLVEPHLGAQGYIRDVGGMFLATRSPHDKLLFDHGHERALTPRYTWTDGPGGLKLGKLVEGA